MSQMSLARAREGKGVLTPLFHIQGLLSLLACAHATSATGRVLP